MPSERDLMSHLQSEVARLVQAVSDAEFWHNRWLEQAEQTHGRRAADVETQHQRRTADIEAQYQQLINDARAAYDAKWCKIVEETTAISQSAGLLAADWDDPLWSSWVPPKGRSIPPVTRLGRLVEPGRWHRLTLPALLPLIGSHNLLIKASGAGKDIARAAMQSITLRLLAALPPGKLRLVCIDPVGVGSTMAGFIKGLPDFLTGGQAWFEQSHIEQRLADLEARMAFVKQKYLGVSFPTMEAYNDQAGQIEEPYYLLVVADFPARFTDSAAQRLLSIATNGPGTGVYVLVMVDEDQAKKLHSFTLADLERTAGIISCQSTGCVWLDNDFKDCQLELDSIPPSGEFERIVNSVAAAAIADSGVKVPFAALSRTKSGWEEATTTGAGVRVPIGRFGARETQYFALDEELKSSALVIGRTGSGKSTLLHILVNGLALAYPPDELELFLLDLQEVEFKDYATYQLPHARVVAINCEREFGLSVLRGLDAELHARMETFRSMGVTSLSEYRSKAGIDQKLPRVLLIVDEFQELFITDDGLATEAGLLLDRLVRQGRKFGVNVLLASQTLAGRYTFSDATKNQIPIRIVLQCSDADSRLALSDDNDHARLLERPGEAIYNATNGRIEGNNRFQVAWLSDDEREAYLRQVRKLADASNCQSSQPQIVFEGNAPAQVENNRDLLALLSSPAWPTPRRSHQVWLGEPLAIKAHTAAILREQSRANLLIVGQNEYEASAVSMLTAAVLSLAAQRSPDDARFVVFNLSQADASWHDLPEVLRGALPHKVTVIARRRDVLAALDEIAAEVNSRLAQPEGTRWPALYCVIIGLHRARDLRRIDALSFRDPFSREVSDEGAAPQPKPWEQLANICRDGPDVGVHTLTWCDTHSNLERVLDRYQVGEFDLRVALQMSTSESRALLDSEAAAKLGPYRAFFFDEDRAGQLEKFRPYGLPKPELIAAWGALLKARK